MKFSSFLSHALVLGAAQALSVPTLHKRAALTEYDNQATSDLMTCEELANASAISNGGSYLFTSSAENNYFNLADIAINNQATDYYDGVGFIVSRAPNVVSASDANPDDCPADWSVSFTKYNSQEGTGYLVPVPATVSSNATVGDFSYECKGTTTVLPIDKVSPNSFRLQLTVNNGAVAGSNGCYYMAQLVLHKRVPYQDAPLTDLKAATNFAQDNLVTAASNSGIEIPNFVGKLFPVTNETRDEANEDPIELLSLLYTDGSEYRLRGLGWNVQAYCPDGASTFTVVARANDTDIAAWSYDTAIDPTDAQLSVRSDGGAPVKLADGAFIDTSNTNLTVTLVPQAVHSCDIYAQFTLNALPVVPEGPITEVTYSNEPISTCDTFGDALKVIDTELTNTVFISGSGDATNTTLVNIPEQSEENSVTITGFSYTIAAVDENNDNCEIAFDVVVKHGGDVVSQLSKDSESSGFSCQSTTEFLPLRKRGIDAPMGPGFVTLDSPIDTSNGNFTIEVGPGIANDDSCFYFAQIAYQLKSPYNETAITELTGSDDYDAQATCENIVEIADDFTSKVHNLVVLSLANEGDSNVTLVDIPQETNETLAVDIYRIGYTVKVIGEECSNFNISAFMNDTEIDVLHTTNDTAVQDCIAYSMTQDFEQPISTSAGNLKVYIVPETPSLCRYVAHIVYNDFENVEPTPTPEPTDDAGNGSTTATTTTTRGSGSGSGATGSATPSSGASEKAAGSIAAGFLAAVAAILA